MTKQIQYALKTGSAIFIGYFPVAMAFGMLAKSYEITLFESFFFSVMVFAGASQFIALNLMATGSSVSSIILTTLLVNFRHFLMSAYLSTKLNKIAKKYVFLIAFGVTDEVFSILSLEKQKLSHSFILSLQLLAYSGWVGGTITGYILGGFFSQILMKSLGIALYTLLLAILIPEIKKSLKMFTLALLSGLLNTVLIRLEFIPDGWSIICCILIVAFTGSFFITNKACEDKSL